MRAGSVWPTVLPRAAITQDLGHRSLPRRTQRVAVSVPARALHEHAVDVAPVLRRSPILVLHRTAAAASTCALLPAAAPRAAAAVAGIGRRGGGERPRVHYDVFKRDSIDGRPAAARKVLQRAGQECLRRQVGCEGGSDDCAQSGR